MKPADFDAKFDAGDRVTDLLDLAKARRPALVASAREEAAVLEAATAIAGDRELAVRWYRQQRIHALGDETSEALIRDGQVEQVLKYLEMLDAGSLG